MSTIGKLILHQSVHVTSGKIFSFWRKKFPSKWLVWEITIGIVLLMVLTTTFLGEFGRRIGRHVNRIHGSNIHDVDVIWLQHIFLPHSDYLENHRRVLKSLAQYHDNLCIVVRFMGWALTDDLWNKWREMYDKYRLPYWEEPIRMYTNFGQAYAFRYMSEKPLECRFVATAGSDVALDSFGLAEALAALEKVQGHVLGLSLRPDSFHVMDWFEADPEIGLARVPYKGGMAGGITFFQEDAYRKVDGYTVRGVYGPDDGDILLNAFLSGYSAYISLYVYGHHTVGDTKADPAWMDWKRRSMSFALSHNKPILTEAELLPWALESHAIFRKWGNEEDSQ